VVKLWSNQRTVTGLKDCLKEWVEVLDDEKTDGDSTTFIYHIMSIFEAEMIRSLSRPSRRPRVLRREKGIQTVSCGPESSTLLPARCLDVFGSHNLALQEAQVTT
jgi:hypothetical protein